MSVELDPKWYIKNVKELVATRLGLSPEEVKIIFAGKELHDSIIIEVCYITERDFLNVALIRFFYYYLLCEAIGTAATPGLLCQPQVIVKMIVEKQMEFRLVGETEVLGENLPQRHFCPSQNPT
jgi:hypothetical protein